MDEVQQKDPAEALRESGYVCAECGSDGEFEIVPQGIQVHKVPGTTPMAAPGEIHEVTCKACRNVEWVTLDV